MNPKGIYGISNLDQTSTYCVSLVLSYNFVPINTLIGLHREFRVALSKNKQTGAYQMC